MIRLVVALLAFLLASPALAQQAPDPRISGPALKALAAEIEYRDAIIRAQQEDAAKLAAWWAEYVRGAAAAPDKTPEPPPPSAADQGK